MYIDTYSIVHPILHSILHVYTYTSLLFLTNHVIAQSIASCVITLTCTFIIVHFCPYSIELDKDDSSAYSSTPQEEMVSDLHVLS